jgi:mRNA interferase RelE/StbE
MTYKLEFDVDALKEWHALDKSVRQPLLKKLVKRLESPHVPNECLHGALAGLYKIKDNKSGYRLVYGVEDDRVVVYVLAVAKRDKLEVYRIAQERLRDWK